MSFPAIKRPGIDDRISHFGPDQSGPFLFPAPGAAGWKGLLNVFCSTVLTVLKSTAGYL
jgi:hypothetical protein